jgi:SNF2 family DNA or RNA helicase
LRHFKHAKLIVTKQDEDDWNAGKILIGLVHPASAAHGLNLQHGGHNIAFFSHWWDLELYQQVIDRIGPVRQLQSGYDRPVFVHKIMARNTVDERVDRRRTTKESVQAAVRDRVESHRRAA